MRVSRRWGSIGLLAGLGFTLMTAWSTWPGPPRLEISPEFDVGELEHDQEISLALTFRNAGEQPLNVAQPVAGCACVLTKLEQDTFQPGEQGTFQITTRAAQAPNQEYRQEIHLRSNDPVHPQRTVVLRGRMASSLVAKPASLQVDRAVCGKTLIVPIEIRCQDPTVAFSITNIACDLVELNVETPSANPERSTSCQIQVSYTPRTIGHQRGSLRVSTDHPRYRMLTIPVELRATSNFQVTPASILLGGANHSSDGQQIQIAGPEHAGLTLPPATADDFFDVELSQVAASAWELSVRPILQDESSGVKRSSIVLTVSGVDGEREISIPVVKVPAITSSIARQ